MVTLLEQERERKVAQLLEHYIRMAWVNAGLIWEPDNTAEMIDLAHIICEK